VSDSEELGALADAVRALLAKRSDGAAVRRAVLAERGFDEALWAVLCEQIGVAALAVPERFGGLGAGLVETHAAMVELGRTLTPSPMLGSAVLAAQLLLDLGDEQTCARLLPGLAAGTSIAAVCWSGPDGRWETGSASVRAQGERLSGRTAYVLDGDIADVLLVVAHDGAELGVFEVDPSAEGVGFDHTPAMDVTRRLAAVSFDNTPGRRIPSSDSARALRSARDTAWVALSGEQVGAAARLLEQTVAYSKVRVQFGRPIGSFQALKHRMADLHVLVEAALSTSYAAARGEVVPAVARTVCSETFATVAGEAIQLHGGIAITWEHDAHLYFKRAHSSGQLLGRPGAHALAELAGLSPHSTDPEAR
jgi:alkylation response protein AidB-like acyl-CoA dehydrogenase